MGIAGDKPRQLAPTVGTTGSGSTNSLAPSSTNTKIDINPAIDSAVGIAVPIDTDTNAKINIDPAINSPIGIVVPIYTDASAEISIDTTTSSATELVPVATIVGPTSSAAGAVLAITGGFDVAFGLFSFHVDDNGVTELISVGDSAPPAMTPGTPPVTGGNPSATALLAPLAPLEEEPRLEELTPSVGSNGFEDPPPSPTTAYCIDCDAYHYVGAGDFSFHEIAGCEDPREGTAAVYPTISECERALNALMLRTAPYYPDYVKGLYSDYTCSDDDDDVYPKAKGKIGNSASFCSPSESAASSDDYAADYDSDFMIEVGSYVKNDDVYPPALGKISDDSTPWSGGHCMMASHDDGNENRANNGRNRTNSGRQVVTHDQISLARRVYAGEANFGLNPSPSDMAVLRFVVQEQK
jgi:hypothetical protein